jgi:hypothetical protein
MLDLGVNTNAILLAVWNAVGFTHMRKRETPGQQTLA